MVAARAARLHYERPLRILLEVFGNAATSGALVAHL
jgi:hypothetical protein